MAKSIAMNSGTVAAGSPDYVSGSNWSPGRTVGVYVGGQWAGCLPSGPFGIVPYGGIQGQIPMPELAAGAHPVEGQDNTDETTATTTVTLT